MPLYLRLSDHALDIAEYELRQEPVFHFSTFRLRPQASFTINLREACATDPLLQRHDPSTGETCILVCGPVTPVPLSDFQEEDCTAVYRFCFPGNQPLKVFYDTLPRANAALLFALDATLVQQLEEHFPNTRFVSSQTALLRHFSVKGTHPAGTRVFAYRYDDVLEISVFDESRLLLCNRFAVHSASDVAYYTLGVVHQLSLGTDVPVFVAGEPATHDETVSLLRSYASGVNLIHPAAEYNRHIVSTTPHVPYDLMTLLLG